jgi:hypothetical protein
METYPTEDTVSAALCEAYRLLREDMQQYIENAEGYGDDSASWTDEEIDTAGELIGDLAMTLRWILGPHRSAEHGRCATCDTDWPCQVVRVMHELLTHPDTQMYKLTQRKRDEAMHA